MTDTTLPEDLERCIAFHGHWCPGLTIGYLAAKAGMAQLGAGRSEDEEFIAVVENDSCAVDAVQVLTGCTFGKGNLYFQDWGKMAFTFARRDKSASVRLYLRPAAAPVDDDAPEQEQRRRRIRWMLEQDPADLFDIRMDALAELPHAAVIRESVCCDRCGEMVMSTRIR